MFCRRSKCMRSEAIYSIKNIKVHVELDIRMHHVRRVALETYKANKTYLTVEASSLLRNHNLWLDIQSSIYHILPRIRSPPILSESSCIR